MVRNVAGVGQAAGAPAKAAASPPGKYLPPLPARSQGHGETAMTPVLEGGFGAQGGSSSMAPIGRQYAPGTCSRTRVEVLGLIWGQVTRPLSGLLGNQMTDIRRALEGEEAKPSRKPAALNRCPSGSPLGGARAQWLPRLGKSVRSLVSAAVSRGQNSL